MIKITDKTKCSGCGACAAVCPAQCIDMRPDEEGFLYPLADAARCTRCGRCRGVCPCLQQAPGYPVKSSWVALAQNLPLRKASTSGGVFALLAGRVIAGGGLVFGAAYANGENFEVVHKSAATLQQLEGLKRSKYVQSVAHPSFAPVAKALKAGRQVLFCGTPCQVQGLLAYLGKRPPGLTLLQLVCHGVPPHKVFAKYLQYLRQKKGWKNITDIRFRDKSFGVQAQNMGIYTAGKTHYIPNDVDCMLRVFRAIALRPICYACPFKGGDAVADLTIGDYWRPKEIDPALDDAWGASAVLAHTPKGQALVKQLEAGDAYIRPVTNSQKMEENLLRYRTSVPLPPGRQDFFKDLDSMPFDKLADKYCPISPAQRVKGRLRPVLQRAGLWDVIKKLAMRAS